MTAFYDQIIVNGYDKHGGLLFSEEFTGNQEALNTVLQRAYSVKHIAHVAYDLDKFNISFFDHKGNEIYNSMDTP